MGSASAYITGSGSIASGLGSGQDLLLLVNNSQTSTNLLAGVLEIGAVIANGAGANGLDKLGPGEVVLSGANTFTGVTTQNAGVMTARLLASANFAAATAVSSVTVNGSTVVTLPNTVGFSVGQGISGTGIPGGTTVAKILDGTHIEISAAATSTGSPSLTFAANTIFNGTISSTTTGGSSTVTVTSTAGLILGERVSGFGIPEGATISKILDSTHYVLSVPTSGSGTNALTYAGTTSSVGASNNLVGNLILNGGEFQYGGGTVASNRSFTINSDGRINVANENTVLNITGQFATPGNQGDYSLTKLGAGTLRLEPSTIAALNSGFGLTQINANGGLLQLVLNYSSVESNGTARNVASAGNNDRYARSDISSLTVGGGGIELLGAKTNNLSQTMPGAFTVNQGSSIVKVSSELNITTSLFLMDPINPTSVDRRNAGTVLFVENPGPNAVANIFIRNVAIDQNVPIPWAAYRDTSDSSNLAVRMMPGVNDFALVAGSNSAIIDADAASVYSVAAPLSFAENASTWNSISQGNRYLSEGSSAFTGTTASNQDIELLRYTKQAASTVTISDVLTLNKGAILTASRVGNNLKTISGGILTSGYGPGTALNDLIVHNYNVAAPFVINSQVSDFSSFHNDLFGNTGNSFFNAFFYDSSVLAPGTKVSGTGFQTGTTILSVTFDSFTGLIKVNISAPLTADLGEATFSKPVNIVQSGASFGAQNTDTVLSSPTIIGDTVNGSNVVTNLTTVAGLSVGMRVVGTGIANGVSITAIDTGLNRVTLSSNATVTQTQGLDFLDIRSIGSYDTGVGTTLLTGTNTYTGGTYVQGGVLRLGSQFAVPGGIAATGGTSHIVIDGGVLGLGFDNFARPLGQTASTVEFTGSGGFAAYGGNRSVDLGGPVAWDRNAFVPAGGALILGAADSDGTITFTNPIDLGRLDRVVRADAGISPVDGILSGALSGENGRLIKDGLGTLSLTGVNTYTGGTVIGNGALIGNTPATAFGSGTIGMGTTSDSRIDDAIQLVLGGGSLPNAISVGNQNSEGVTSVSATSTISLNGSIALTRNLFASVASGTTTTVNGTVSGAGGLTVVGGGTLSLTQANSYGVGTAGAGALINGATIIRSGTVLAGNSTALGAGTVELGDTKIPVASPASTVDVATNGISLTMKGGIFKPDHNGSFDTSTGAGPGAFVGIGSTIDGVSYTAGDVGKRVLVKDEGGSPERNGVYEIVSVSGSTMNLKRVTYPDLSVNPQYGTTVLVQNGSAAGETYFMASATVINLNRGDTDPSIWLRDSATSDVALMASTSGVNIANALDVNATNGAGSTSIGTVNAAVTGAVFSGGITLQNVLSGVAETKSLTLTSADASAVGVRFTGVISEADGLGATPDVLSVAKTGSGVATLSNANSYHGLTDVQTGTLRATNGGALGAADGTLATGTMVSSGATLEIDGTGGNLLVGNERLSLSGTGVGGAGALHVTGGAGNTWAGPVNLASAATVKVETGAGLTFSNVVSGNPLTKDGLGTLTLAGANTYTDTIITAGTLQIGNGGTSGTLGTGPVTDNGLLLFNRSDSVTVANVISGTGSVTQGGTGTTILTANNSYVNTTISSGTLQIGNGGTSGTLGSGPVTDNGLLVFNRTDTVTVSNSISGIGSLTQLGTGTTILTGANSYTNTTITAGTLQVGNGGTSGSLGSGPVADNSVLKFNRSDAIVVNNTISGTGSLNQSGSGRTAITGSNTYSGGTTVTAGTLLANNVSGSATGSGFVSVQSGAVLGGTGSVIAATGNSITIGAGATLSVGDASGTAAFLRLSTSGSGALTLTNNTSVVTLDLISGAGTGDHSAETLPVSADRVVVSGAVNLNGARLTVGNPNSMLVSAFQVGDRWRLFDWSLALAGTGTLGTGGANTFGQIDLPTLSAGKFWDVSSLYTSGTIAVVSVPEASRIWMLVLAMSAFITRRRRNW
jgi:autotransporter-associated beta strand protein